MIAKLARAWPILALGLVVAISASPYQGQHPSAFAADEPQFVEVTSSGDSVVAGESECPDAVNCTLRRAIELVNADEAVARYTITFDPAVFPPSEPATIAILETPLPELTRDLVTIDASMAGVTLDGGALPAEDAPPWDGLRLSGIASIVRGLAVRHFTGTCLLVTGGGATVGGERSKSHGNTAGDCATGVEAAGGSAVVHGNDIGFARDGTRAPVANGLLLSGSSVEAGRDIPALRNVIGNATVAISVAGSTAAVSGNDIGVTPGGGAASVGTAIAISAPGASIGGATAARANFIANVQAGVRVGGNGGAAFSGTEIRYNTFGTTRAGAGGPVGTGITLLQPSTGSRITDNAFMAVTGAAVTVGPNLGGVSVTANEVRRNSFGSLGGLAIDLNADGLVNPNDDGDIDDGANGLLNHPVIAKAIQARVSGAVSGSCGGCTVDLYMVAHSPGGEGDHATAPVLAASTVTDPAGSFAFENPPLGPGDWVTAIVTDPAGNTSEFAPPARVGTGVVQCGNITLHEGWNHSGFFGAVPLALGAAYPSALGLPSRVTGIYRMHDGNGDFDHWLSGGPSTLNGLEPAGAYWFLSTTELEVPGGFALNVPLPVQLKAGWNDFVYIGATADVRDALASISGKYRDLYRFVNDDGQWLSYGRADTPAWAREFTELQSCATYEVFVTEDVTLAPLQP